MKTSQYRLIVGMLFLILLSVGNQSTPLQVWASVGQAVLALIYFVGAVMAACKE